MALLLWIAAIRPNLGGIARMLQGLRLRPTRLLYELSGYRRDHTQSLELQPPGTVPLRCHNPLAVRRREHPDSRRSFGMRLPASPWGTYAQSVSSERMV